MVSQANLINAILIIFIVISYCPSLSKNQSSKNQYSFNNKAMMKSYSKNQLKKCAEVSSLQLKSKDSPIIFGASSASWSSSRIDAFVRGIDNALWHIWFVGVFWSNWESLGGVLTSGPAVASWGYNRLDVFGRGTDNALWHKWWNGSWSAWESLGGALTSAPAAASWGYNRIDILARGTDNALWHKSWSGLWSAWESFGYTVLSEIAVSSRTFGVLDIFMSGVGNALYYFTYTVLVTFPVYVGGVMH